MRLRCGRINQHPVDIGAMAEGDIVNKASRLKFAGDIGPFIRAQATFMAVIRIQPHAHNHIWASFRTGRFENFAHYSHAVFQRAAIIILPKIGCWRQELIKKITMGHAMYFYPVKSSFTGIAG